MRLLELDRVTKKFGSLAAVNHVTLSIESAEIHSIIGPNGAGKTTLLSLITGTQEIDEGKIIYDGEDITELSENKRAQAGIVRAYQIPQLFHGETVEENLVLAGLKNKNEVRVSSRPSDALYERVSDLLEKLELEEQADEPADNLSHGNKKKLEIGMAMINEPSLLLLDEPTSGVSEAESGMIISLIHELSEDYTMVVVEHNIQMVMSISDRITVLDRGQIVATDTPDAIRENEKVTEAYLGGT